MTPDTPTPNDTQAGILSLMVLICLTVVADYVAGGRGIALMWLGLSVEWLDAYRLKQKDRS